MTMSKEEAVRKLNEHPFWESNYGDARHFINAIWPIPDTPDRARANKEQVVEGLMDWGFSKSMAEGLWEIIPAHPTPEPAPEVVQDMYGLWIIWNAKPDSKCPDDVVGMAGQIHIAGETHPRSVPDLSRFGWSDVETPIIRYRIRQTPALVKPIVMWGAKYSSGWTINMCRVSSDTHRIALQTNPDGSLMDKGTYTTEKLK